MSEQSFTHTIDGKAEGSPASFDVVNPATGAPFAKCPDATREQLDRAVAAARRAQPAWAALSYDQRRAYLNRFSAALKEKAKPIAELITKEQGKPLADSLGEMAGSSRSLEGMARVELHGEVIRDDERGRFELHYKPFGVVAGITPWNVPVGLAMHKVAQALICGNTLVLKPSPYTPLATLVVGDIARSVFPAGVYNTLAGGNDLGRWMTEHEGIDRVTFTGSVATGKRVAASAAGTLKRVTLELGGNDPAIVLDDADLAATTQGIFNGAFRNCGQICMAIKRVYVPERMYEPVVEGLARLARDYRVGDGFEDGVQMGPIQNKMQFDKVVDILEDTKRQPGVRIVTGGHTLNRPGYFVAPTVVADIADDTRLVREEQFGPVVPVLRYKEVDDAVRRANDTRFGLCASVWGKDVDRAAQVAGRIEAGTVWVNKHIGSEADVPFGGFKDSGLGREHGVMGMQSYMEAQVVWTPPRQ